MYPAFRSNYFFVTGVFPFSILWRLIFYIIIYFKMIKVIGTVQVNIWPILSAATIMPYFP